ncbi:hypothetical protein BH18VER1_BH18VER1_14790 [soil metagenome]
MLRSYLAAALCLTILPLALGAAPSPSPAARSPIQQRADQFLSLTNASYQALYRVNSEAQWKAVTDVSPEHDAAAEATGKAYAAFNGNPAVILEAQELLQHKDELDPLSVRELKQVLLNAGEGPMTNPTLTNNRIASETKQASILGSSVITDCFRSDSLLRCIMIFTRMKSESGAIRDGSTRRSGKARGIADHLGDRTLAAIGSARVFNI